MSIGFRTVLLATMAIMGLALSEDGVTKTIDRIPDKGDIEAGISGISGSASSGAWTRANQRAGKTISSSNKVQDVVSFDKTAGKSHVYDKDRRNFISALSKLARVRLASRERDVVDPTRSSVSRTISEESDRPGSIPETRNEFDSSEKREKSRKYRCRAIRDVYIPDVGGTMPAYHCKLGDKTFVLSSVRFLQDRRSFLDIEIDENAVRELRVAPKASRNNSLEILPAILVLKPGDEDYEIRSRRKNSAELVNDAN